MKLICFHVHTKWIRMGKKRLQGTIEFFINWDKPAKIFDADLDIVLISQVI